MRQASEQLNAALLGDPASHVREARLRLGLTQIELARLLDVSNVTVNRWERGKCQPGIRRFLENAPNIVSSTHAFEGVCDKSTTRQRRWLE